MSKKKTISVGTIKFTDLLISAKNKPNRSQQEVFRGTGYYEDKKKYKRSREKQKMLREYVD
jgi:hypothetical protein